MRINLIDGNKLDLDTMIELKNQGVDTDQLEFALVCPLEILDENEKLIPSDSLGLRRLALRSFCDIEWKKLYYDNTLYAIGLGYK